MNILIIGLGYAGGRFLAAAKQLQAEERDLPPLSLAYVGPKNKNAEIPYFSEIEEALKEFQPDIIVNSSNDIFHLDVIKKLGGYGGFLLNEKPLITPFQNIECVKSSLDKINGFVMDMVERYSEATSALRNYVRENMLEPIRISFIWGKNRLEDHRPTCGVGSEVIHALDLIEYVIPSNSEIVMHGAIGISSDFSVSGADILDTVHLTGLYDKAVIDGYASFVNIDRQRNIDFTFRDPSNKLIYARLVYDTPGWDLDTLDIWERDDSGATKMLLALKTEDNPKILNAHGLYKIKSILKSAINFRQNNQKLDVEFCDLRQSIKLYALINQLYALARNGPIANYHALARRIVTNAGNSETLG